ncbi:MAG TPA: LacI family DNA-binding transcriptional regulator [Kineosporiaceae bacterium]
MSRPPTLADVARVAGVSLATASRVLNSRARPVGEPYRSKVLAAARSLGYAPNTLAQAVARGSSNVLGLIVHDVTDPYFGAITDGVTQAAEQSGLVVVLAVTRRDPERELDYLMVLRGQRARAVILAGSRTTSAEANARLATELEAFQATGGAAAAIAQNGLGIHTVVPLNRAGAHDLALALHGLGHRRFAVLAGPQDLVTALERLTGFLHGLESAGIDPGEVRVIPGAFTRDGGVEAARALLAEGKPVTCVFAVNDVMAVGAMSEFRRSGVAIPGDLSIAGFDDIDTLQDVAPRLTSVRLPLEEMGAQAARLALSRAEGAPTVVRFPGDVRLRQSVRRL